MSYESEKPFTGKPQRVHKVESTGSSERVPFRLIQTPCCMALICWVNPRLPSYCPECGKSIYPAVKSCVLTHDENATLRVSRFYVTTPKGGTPRRAKLYYTATLTEAGIAYCKARGKAWRGEPMECTGDSPQQALADLNKIVETLGLTFLPEHVVLA